MLCFSSWFSTITSICFTLLVKLHWQVQLFPFVVNLFPGSTVSLFFQKLKCQEQGEGSNSSPQTSCVNFCHADGQVNPGPLFITCFNRLSLALIARWGLLLLCWSGGAADHSPKETPRLLVAHHFLQLKLGVSKSHSSIWILRSERVYLGFRGVHPLNQMQKEMGIAGALEAMPASLVCVAVYLLHVRWTFFFCYHQGLWLKAWKLLGHRSLSIQFFPVVGGEEGPKPSGRWSGAAHAVSLPLSPGWRGWGGRDFAFFF